MRVLVLRKYLCYSLMNENTAMAKLNPGTDMERKDKNDEGTKRRLEEML